MPLHPCQLTPLVDRTWFGLVKSYYRSPRTEIWEVILVRHDLPIEEVGAASVGNLETFHKLVAAEGVAFGTGGVPGERYVAVRWFRLDAIPDDAWCDVLYLPPAYVVKLRNDELSAGVFTVAAGGALQPADASGPRRRSKPV